MDFKQKILVKRKRKLEPKSHFSKAKTQKCEC